MNLPTPSSSSSSSISLSTSKGDEKKKIIILNNLFESSSSDEDEKKNKNKESQSISKEISNRKEGGNNFISADESPWIKVGLQVVIKNEELSRGRYHNKIGIIEKVQENGFGAIIKVNEDLILLDQDDCLPSINGVGYGEEILIISGKHKDKFIRYLGMEKSGKEAILEFDNGHHLSLPPNQICRIIKR